jgi:pimeloyl-ACP methyl ester carboxylesterase
VIGGSDRERPVPETGTALVLLHGLGATPEMWKPQVVGLSRHHQVLTPRLPGVGEKGTDESFTLARAAESVAEVIARQTDGRAHVCGVGLGAMVAMRLALDHGDRVHKLILAGVEVPTGRAPHDMESPRTLRKLARRWFGNPGRDEDTLVAAWQELGQLDPPRLDPPPSPPADRTAPISRPVPATPPPPGEQATEQGAAEPAGEAPKHDATAAVTEPIMIEPVVMEPVVVKPAVPAEPPEDAEQDGTGAGPGEAADPSATETTADGPDTGDVEVPADLSETGTAEVTDVLPEQPTPDTPEGADPAETPADAPAEQDGEGDKDGSAQDATEATTVLPEITQTEVPPETPTETTTMIPPVKRTRYSPLAEITATTMVMCGSKDKANLPAARKLAEDIPEAVLTVVPQVGHVWNHTHPDLFNEIVLGFLEDTDEFEELFGIMY